MLQGINAFTHGMRSVNPKAEVKVIWVNSWFDPGKERDAVITLMGRLLHQDCKGGAGWHVEIRQRMEGMVKLEGFGPAVPADVKQLVEARQKEIVAGTLTPFAVPVKDNEGKVRLEKGPMSDDALNKMDYYVEGISGKLPGK